MSLRFRRTIKIAPGIRLNVGKSGLSVSAGVRGARVTVGSRGVTGTVGLPGSGLSYTTKLTGPSESRQRGQSKKAMRESLYLAKSSEVEREVNAYEKFRNLAAYSPPLTTPIEWEKQLNPRNFSLGEYNLRIPTFDDFLSIKQREAFEQEARKWPFISASLLLLLSSIAAFLFVRNEKVLFASLSGVLSLVGIIFCIRVSQSSKKLAIALAEEGMKEVQRNVEQAKAQHNSTEERRISALKDLYSGDSRALELRLEEVVGTIGSILASAEHTVDINLGFEVYEGKCIYIDLDLPEIEVVAKQTSKRVLKTGEVREKAKPQKVINQEYAEGVVGICFFVAAHVLNASPSLQEVVISGYTQRTDSKTGNAKDDYVYSVKFNRENFSKLNLVAIAALDGITNFPHKIDLTKSFELRSIEPFKFEKN